MKVTLATPESTEAFGRALAAALPPAPVVLFLEGDLGAGKTTTARAFLRGLGVAGAVKSPTYTLIERYDTPVGEVAHLDLYRIADPEELDYLALDELAVGMRAWLVEWPERGQGVLPAADAVLRLSRDDGAGRIARFLPGTAVGQAWHDALLEQLAKPWSGKMGMIQLFDF